MSNFITNNYANNYYVADQDESISAGSVDGLGLDEIDEIDTNNMAIYSADLPIKKERRTANVILNNSVRPTQVQQPKKEKTVTMPVKVIQEPPKESRPTSESLLLPSSSECNQELNSVDADLMLNILGDDPSTSNKNDAGGSNQMNDSNVARNSVYEETSQVSSFHAFGCTS